MKTYLGDAVYAEITEQGVVLTTEDGIRVTNRVVLETDIYHALVKFVARYVANARAGAGGE